MSVSRPSTAGEASEDTVAGAPDESHGSREKTLGDQPDQGNPLAPVTTNGAEYLEGVALVLVTACVTLVCFLVLLDTSIIATVRHLSRVSVWEAEDVRYCC